MTDSRANDANPAEIPLPDPGPEDPPLLQYRAAIGHKIVAALAEGNYLETAAWANSLTPNTVRGWLARGWKELHDAGQRQGRRSALAAFALAARKAAAQAEETALAAVRAGGRGWQGQAWFLERTRAQRFARREFATIDARVGRLDKLPEPELLALVRQALSVRGVGALEGLPAPDGSP